MDGIFDSILLDPELGIIDGNPLGSNDCTKLDPLLGTSEGTKYGINDGLLDEYSRWYTTRCSAWYW